MKTENNGDWAKKNSSKAVNGLPFDEQTPFDGLSAPSVFRLPKSTLSPKKGTNTGIPVRGMTVPKQFPGDIIYVRVRRTIRNQKTWHKLLSVQQ
jgi:hypothetical protein